MTDIPRLLRLPEVMRLTGLRRDSVYRLAREGLFPPPRKIAPNSTAWREDEIRAWIDSRPVAAPRTVGRAAERKEAS